MIPETDHKIPIKHADILPNLARAPSVLCASGAQEGEGKIQNDSESREQLQQRADGTNRFLESVLELSLAVPPPYVLIFPSDEVAYEIFRNRSGLSDGHLAMLILVVGRVVPRGPWLSSS